MTDAPKLEAAQITFLSPLLGLARSDTVVLNAHVPTEDVTDNTKNSFYRELGRVFHQVRPYQMEKVS
jgi:hypothetical protein